jgi:hypothetical protein
MGTLRITLDDTMEVSLLVEFCSSDVMFGHRFSERFALRDTLLGFTNQNYLDIF